MSRIGLPAAADDAENMWSLESDGFSVFRGVLSNILIGGAGCAALARLYALGRRVSASDHVYLSHVLNASGSEGYPVIEALLLALQGANVLRIVASHVGSEEIFVPTDACLLRQIDPEADSGIEHRVEYHQDCSVMRDDLPGVTCWVPLTPCGVDAPGLSLLPRRLSENLLLRQPFARAARGLDNTLDTEAVEAMIPVFPVEPQLEPGDVILFDWFTIHRSGRTSPGRYPRLSLELRACRARDLPEGFPWQRGLLVTPDGAVWPIDDIGRRDRALSFGKFLLAGQPDRAAVAASRYLQDTPRDPVVLSLLAAALEEMGRGKQAADMQQASADIGGAYYSDSLVSVEQSLGIHSTHPFAQRRRARRLIAARRAAEALPLLENVAHSTKWPADYDLLARTYKALGRTQDAVRLHGGLDPFQVPLSLWSPEAAEQQRRGIERGVPPILLNTIPKSGSTYFPYNVAHHLDVPVVHVSYLGLFVDDTAVPKWVSRFAEGGAVCRSHLCASADNIAQLRRHGIEQMVVHIRDLRQVVLSFSHYVREACESEDVLQAMALTAYAPEEYRLWSFERQLDWNIAHMLPEFVRWLEGWVNANDRGDISVLFTRFEDFVEDPARFYARVAAFFGLPSDTFEEMESIPVREGQRNFRKGLTDEWRTAFSASQRSAVEQAVPEYLLQRFGWLN